MLVSKRMLHVGRRGSTLLWQSVACKPTSGEGMRKLLGWLAPHSRHIRRISLHPSEDYKPPSLLPLWGMMTSAFVMTAPALLR